MLPVKTEAESNLIVRKAINSMGELFAVVIAASIVCVMYLRLYFGVDTSDEGFYMAMSYFFARDGQPFVQEWAAQQGAAVIFSPLVRIYISITGSTDGLILFGRHMYFLLTLFASWGVWRICRRNLGNVAALFPALLPIVFHPGGVPNISYNTLGALCWLLGTACLYSCYISDTNDRYKALVASALLVIASFAYPPLLIIIIFVLCASFILAPSSIISNKSSNNVRNHRYSLLVGTLLFPIPLIYVVFVGGLEPILSTYAASSGAEANQLGGLEKLTIVINHVIQSWRYGALVIVCLIIFSIPRLQGLWRWFLIILGASIFAFCINTVQHIWLERDLTASSIIVIWIGLLCPLFFLFRSDRNDWKHLVIIWPTSLIAGVLTAWASSVWVEGALGLLPAAVLSLYYLLSEWKIRDQVLRTVPVFFLLICVALPQFNHVYQESPLTELRQFISSGPYLGLLTSKKSAAISESLLIYIPYRRIKVPYSYSTIPTQVFI